MCVDIFVDQCQVVNQILRDAKSSYYLSITSENASDPKILFNTVDKLLHCKEGRRYPTAPSKMELAYNFAAFLKLATIITKLSTCSTHSSEANREPYHVGFAEFRVMTEKEIATFVDTFGKKLL